MSTTLLKGPLIVTQNANRQIFRGNLLYEDGVVAYVGPDSPEADEVIDFSGKMICPGFINTHTHVAMTHLRGLLDDIPLSDFLARTSELDSQRTSKGIYNSALLGAFEMASSGVTTFLDLYYSEDVIAEATSKVGIRGYLAWATLDDDKTTQKGSPIINARGFLNNTKRTDLVNPCVGVQGVYAASDDVYMSAKELADKYGTLIHTHLAETREEVYAFKKERGVRPAEHLHRIGVTGRNFVAAHGVWLTKNEVRMLASDSSSISWNPASNAKLGVGGVAQVPEMMGMGLNVTLGSDSAGSNNSQDVTSGMKLGSLMLKNERWDPSVLKAQHLLDMATVNGAKALMNDAIGSLEIGKSADIVAFDINSPYIFPVTAKTAVQSIVYGNSIGAISDVICRGKFVKRNGKLAGFDPEYFQGCEFV
ncbi:MAG: amidohydrolase family protein [Thermoplasmataceae archaeon]